MRARSLRRDGLAAGLAILAGVTLGYLRPLGSAGPARKRGALLTAAGEASKAEVGLGRATGQAPDADSSGQHPAPGQPRWRHANDPAAPGYNGATLWRLGVDYDDLWDAEPRDEVWAAATELRIRADLETNLVLAGASAEVTVECRTSMCQIWLRKAQGDREALREALWGTGLGNLTTQLGSGDADALGAITAFDPDLRDDQGEWAAHHQAKFRHGQAGKRRLMEAFARDPGLKDRLNSMASLPPEVRTAKLAQILERGTDQEIEAPAAPSQDGSP